jgi:replicative DNA helicase
MLKETNQFYKNLGELPNNFFAEQAILIILLTNSSYATIILSNLTLESFYNERHKIIYQIILKIIENNGSINVTNIISRLQDQGLLEKIGGINIISNLLNISININDLDFYLENIKEKHLRRKLINLGKDIINSGYSIDDNLEKIFLNIENNLFDLTEEKKIQNIYTSAELVDQLFVEIKGKIMKKESVGFQTSFKDLDSILQGFQPSDLIIIAGRPSMGKTAFALNLGRNIVEIYNIPLLIFSLEMSREQIMYRFLSNESKINSNRLKSGKMTQLEWKKLSLSMKKLSELPIFINDNSEITLGEIKSIIKKFSKSKDQGSLVIIDYLQLMKTNFKNENENRVQEISYLTRNLKTLAKEFNIPIITLSQLSRNVESRTNKKPMLSDLRESGCTTQSFNNNNRIKIWNVKQLYKFNNTIRPSLKGKKPCFLLTFENNITISLTSNHKILSRYGWLKVSEINISSAIYSFVSVKNSINEKKFKYNLLKKIDYEGLKKVYDSTIPLFHNYEQKNILLHNSIEQDADVVIMLYREDYYNEKFEKNYQPQITECIISKHRNGPTGSIKLQFNSLTTSFENL